jgi:hypothetical protein
VSSAEDQWRKVLMTGHRPLVISRRVWRHVPSAPRCKVCGNPFGGIGGRIARVAGYSPSRKNPNLCARCCDALPRGGAEVDIGVLFADVRGSTALGERKSASDYAGLLNRFYAVATDVLLRHDALIDKLIGDQAMALFIPGVAGRDYRRGGRGRGRSPARRRLRVLRGTMADGRRRRQRRAGVRRRGARCRCAATRRPSLCSSPASSTSKRPHATMNELALGSRS